MKRILSLLMFTLMTLVVSAQSIERGNQWYVGANTGAVAPLTELHISDVRSISGVEVGVNVNPFWGVSLTGEGAVNTTGKERWVDNSNVLGNVKYNLTNAILGYDGNPHRFEVLAVAGAGWGHQWGSHVFDRNYEVAKFGAEINMHLDKNKALQLSVRPAVTYDNFSSGLNVNKANGQLTVGVTYKFKMKGSKSHNFTMCPYTVTADEYNKLVTENYALKNTKPVVTEVIKNVEVIKEVPTLIPSTTCVVTFAQNSFALTNDAKTILNSVAAGSKVEINAYASPEGTANYNMNLSKQRAEAVAEYLLSRGVQVNTHYHGAVNNESNRIAIVTLQ